MIDRYSHPAIARIFSDQGRLDALGVASTAAAAITGDGDDGFVVAMDAATDAVNLLRWAELEAALHHDIAAYVRAVREQLPPREAEDAVFTSGKWEGLAFVDVWHVGRTSSDLADTALSIQLDKAIGVIHEECHALLAALCRAAGRHRNVAVWARTHGQHAEPTTVGRILAVTATEVHSNMHFDPSTIEWHLSGPVGQTDVREGAALALALGAMTRPSFQVTPRSGLVAVVSQLVPLSVALSGLAMQVRLAARTGGWAREGRAGALQRGSSAMPTKRNPVRAERVSGLCKLIRSNVSAVAEANAELWEFRDISHSSVERTALVDALQLTAFCVTELTAIVDGLEVRVPPAEDPTNGDHYSGSEVLREAVAAGFGYEVAYERIRVEGAWDAATEMEVEGKPVLYDPASEPDLWTFVDGVNRAVRAQAAESN